MANRDDDQQSGGAGGDSEEELQRALERRTEDLAGDLETNRNMSGSSTYETLSEEGDLDVVQDNDRSGGQGGQGGQR
jgi:hypothetical protein